MCDLDRSLHPDIHDIEDVDILIGHIVASCGCLTKTPRAEISRSGLQVQASGLPA